MSYLKQRLAIVRAPALFLHILSCFFTTLGVGISYLVMSWTIVEMYENVASISLLMSCFWLPGILISPFIGVIIDRYSRKQIIIFTNIIRIVGLVGLGLLFMYYQHPHLIYGLALAIGLAYAFYAPAALAFVRDIAKPHQLMYTNATVDMSYEIGFLIGISSGGLLIAFFSIPTIFFVSAVLFLIAALCTAYIKQLKIKTETPAELTFYKDIVSGLKYLLSKKQLLQLYTIQLAFFALMMTAGIILTPFAKVVLNATPLEFGFIESALSLGVIVGTFVMPYFADKFSVKKVLLLCSSGMGLGFLLFAAFSKEINEAILLYGLIGIFFAGWAVSTTAAQHATAIAFQGRVQTTFNALSHLVILLIYAAVGGLSHIITIRGTYSFLIIIALLAFVVVCCVNFKMTSESTASP